MELDNFFIDLKDKFDVAMLRDDLVYMGDSVQHYKIQEDVNGESIAFDITLLKSLEHRPEQGSIVANPFIRPEPELTVRNSFGYHEEFRIVLNKFPIVKNHFMLTTKEFVSQDTPLSPSELLAAFTLLAKLHEEDKDSQWFSFYNCGPQSGASQPHKHIQFMTLPDKYTPFCLDLLENTNRSSRALQGVAFQVPHVPFAHYVVALPEEKEVNENILLMAFSLLLLKALSVSEEHCEMSYNFCMTTKHMMMIPRRKAKFKNLIGINSCGYMGLILCKNSDIFEHVRRIGVLRILGTLAFPSCPKSN